MQPNKLRAVKPSVSAFLITVVVVLVVSIVFGACTKNSNLNDNPSKSSTTPSPSPLPSGTPGVDTLPGDTIIVIRDGSVRIKVNKENGRCGDGEEDPDKKIYKCENVTLSEIGIQSVNGPTCKALTENSKIKIDGGGAGKEIEIQKNGRDVKIKFSKDYKEEDCTDGSPGEHCGANHIGKIEVDDPAFSKTCINPDEKCEVWIRIQPRQ